MKSIVPVWLAMLSLLVTTQVVGQEKQVLKITPAAGAVWEEALKGSLLDVAVQGQSVGYKGTVTATLKNEILTADPGQAFVTMKTSARDVQARLNGESSRPSAPDPVTLKVYEDGRTALEAAKGDDGFDLMDTGGVPLQIIAILAHGVRFSEEPVTKGQEWTSQDTYGLPGVGDVCINTCWRLNGIEEGVASLASTAAGILPSFKMPSPFGGGDMELRAGKLYITELKQEFDLAQSRVLTSAGKFRLDAQADLGGMQLPVSMTLDFELEQAEPEAEPAK